MEQKWKATNDQSDAENDPKSSQNLCREAPPDTLNRSPEPPRAPSSKEKSHVTPQFAKKSRKSAESRPKEPSLGPKLDPKIDQKSTRTEKSAPRDGAGNDFHRFLAPSPFEVAFQIDFGTVRTFKILLFPQWEHDFRKIAFFTFSSNFDPKWDPKAIYFSQKRARRDPKITKIAEKSSFLVDQNSSSNFGPKKIEKKKRIGSSI